MIPNGQKSGHIGWLPTLCLQESESLQPSDMLQKPLYLKVEEFLKRRVGDDFFWKLTATGSLWSCLSSTLHDQLWTHAIETFRIIYFDPSPSLSQTGLSKLLWTVTVKQGKIMRYAPLTCPWADEMTINHCQHTNNRFANWNKHPCFDVPTLKSSMLGSTEAGDLFVAKVMPRVAPNLLS